MKNKNNKEINIGSLNNVIEISEKILNIAFIFILVVGTYALTILFKEWNVFGFIFSVLKVLSPLFIGILIAWLLRPIVNYLERKNIKRIFALIILYLIIIFILVFSLFTFIPEFIKKTLEMALENRSEIS